MVKDFGLKSDHELKLDLYIWMKDCGCLKQLSKCKIVFLFMTIKQFCNKHTVCGSSCISMSNWVNEFHNNRNSNVFYQLHLIRFIWMFWFGCPWPFDNICFFNMSVILSKYNVFYFTEHDNSFIFLFNISYSRYPCHFIYLLLALCFTAPPRYSHAWKSI